MSKKNIIEYDDYNIENLDFNNPDEIVKHVIESKPIRKVKKGDYKEVQILNPKTNMVRTVLVPKQKRTHPDIAKLNERLSKARAKRVENRMKKQQEQGAQQPPIPPTPTPEPPPVLPPPNKAQHKALYEPDIIRDMVRSEILSHLPKPAMRQRARQPVYDDEQDDVDDILIEPAKPERPQRPARQLPQVPVKNSNIEVSRNLVQHNAYNPMTDIFGIPN